MNSGEIHRQICKDRRIWLFQFHHHCQVVCLGDAINQIRHAHVAEIIKAAARNLMPWILVIRLASKGPQHVISVEITGGGKTVYPRVKFHSLAQVKCECEAIRRNISFLSQCGLSLGCASREFHQLVIDRPSSIKAGARGIDGRGKIFR